MIPAIALFVAGHAGSPTLKISEIAFAPAVKIERILGPKTEYKKVAGVFFYPTGFSKIRANAIGDKMRDIEFSFDSLLSWRTALAKFGVSVKGANIKSLPEASSATPLLRNSIEVSGATGLPKGRPWRVTYNDYAVVNKDRTRKLRPQILAASGEARLRLIRSCYDWKSNVHFIAP